MRCESAHCVVRKPVPSDFSSSQLRPRSDASNPAKFLHDLCLPVSGMARALPPRECKRGDIAPAGLSSHPWHDPEFCWRTPIRRWGFTISLTKDRRTLVIADVGYRSTRKMTGRDAHSIWPNSWRHSTLRLQWTVYLVFQDRL